MPRLITFEKLPRTAIRGKHAVLIKVDTLPAGIITKTPNTKTDIFPWQVFEYTNAERHTKLLGSFYRPEDVAKIPNFFQQPMIGVGDIDAAKAFAVQHFNA